jgi:RNA polymerase sigma factor (TIGR02999 family)
MDGRDDHPRPEDSGPRPRPEERKPAADSDRFFQEVYAELRSIAHARMRGERKGHTLQSTELVHEAYLRLHQGKNWESRAHFFAAAAEAMRRILIDRARARRRIKRGADSEGNPAQKITLDLQEVAELTDDRDPEAILGLDRAIDRLAEQDPRLRDIVRLRFYAGLSVEETAEAIGVSARTVKRDWNFARAWLFDQLARESGADGEGRTPPAH